MAIDKKAAPASKKAKATSTAEPRTSTKLNGGGSVAHAYTFITNGFRAHPDPEDGLPIASLKGAKWKDQEGLQKLWSDAVQEIEEKEYVLGGGDPGIFSSRFTKQVTQVSPVEHVWCYSTGLGMVNLGSKYPQYDLAEYDSSIKNALQPGELSERAWWAFVCSLSGNSIASVIQQSIKAKRRILIALPPLQYTVFRDDLKQAIEEIGRATVKDYVRILGPELEGLLTPQLLPSLMPYDREALDRLVPGNRSHGIRRLARLFNEVCPPTDGPTNPIKDYDSMVEAFADQDREPIVYETGTIEKVTKLKRLQGDELAAKVQEYADICGPIAQRIMRMMRVDGMGVSMEVIQEVLDGKSGSSASSSNFARGTESRGRSRD